MANLFRRDEFAVTRMRVATGAFLPRNTDGSDHGFSWYETTNLAGGTIFGPVALVDHRFTLVGAGAIVGIARTRGWIERGATRDIARDRSAADLFLAARGRRWC